MQQTATLKRIPEVVQELRTTFNKGRTHSFAWRDGQLAGLQRMLREQEASILQALRTDVGKPELEGFMSEVAYCLGEVELARSKLKGWMKPKRVSSPVFLQPGSSYIHKDPLGVVLIIAPWNYPLGLLIGPLIGALAAGNCVVVKPSEVAAATSALAAELLPRYLDAEAVKVVEGAVEETTVLLEQRFDHIFYTGNGRVGRLVMAAAAKHLTPVTLELGGKSPCIVDENVDLEVTLKRICWGKFSNAGQTCVAPDYILAHRRIHDRLLEGLRRTVVQFYGEDPQQSPDYGRVVNERHHRRLMAMIESGEPVVGGQGDEADRYIAPTVLKNVQPDAPVMSDEIFGPILPVLAVDSIQSAIEFVNARPKPLALYVFSNNKGVQDRVLTRTSSGGATVNHCWMHLANPNLPFGGVGESGMGAYHGKASFDVFTHRKSVLRKSTYFDVSLTYPPFTDDKKKWLRRLL